MLNAYYGITVRQHFLSSFLHRQLSRSRIRVSTVTFSRGETTAQRDHEKQSDGWRCGTQRANDAVPSVDLSSFKEGRSIQLRRLASPRNGIPRSSRRYVSLQPWPNENKDVSR